MQPKLSLARQQIIMTLPNFAENIVDESVGFGDSSTKDIDMDVLSYIAEYIINLSNICREFVNANPCFGTSQDVSVKDIQPRIKKCSASTNR